MPNKINLMISTKEQHIINHVLQFRQKLYIDAVQTIQMPNIAASRAKHTALNVFLWDLDDYASDVRLSNNFTQNKNNYIIYTSKVSAKISGLTMNGSQLFLLKPVIFNSISSVRFIANLENILTNFIKQQQPVHMRNLVKIVTANDNQKIVAIGSSTGGTNAIEDILKKLPLDSPPIVIVQHMPSGFTKLFAERLNSLYQHEVIEAKPGDYLMRGRILLAPADRHMTVVLNQGKLAVDCFAGTRIHGVMPAADVLFESVANVCKSKAVGVILTGMGNDGAKGLLQMKNVGCKNIGQNQETCVVYGMPKAAKNIGAIHYELPLDKIPEKIMSLSN